MSKTRSSITLARQLRLAVITNVYKQDFITEVEAKDLLAANLIPGNYLTFYDDSALLNDPKALEKLDKEDNNQ